MKNSMVPYWLAFMLIFALSYGGWKWYQVQLFETAQASGGIEMSQPLLTDFQLPERSGKTFDSAEMKGKVWVTTFFFTTCPGPCKRLNERIKYMHNLEELKDVTWVSITVDPKADTPEALQKYADKFGADPERWLFCRGDLKYIKRIGRDVMSLPVIWQGHNEEAVVIDRQGVVRGMYDVTSISQSEKLEILLRKCLAEPAAGEQVESPAAGSESAEEVDAEVEVKTDETAESVTESVAK